MSAQDNTNSTNDLLTWEYNPSLPLAIAITCIFTILTIAHVFLFFRTRNKACIPFIFGAFNEAGGYLFRALAHNNTSSRIFFSIQLMLILISPIMIVAGLYAVFAGMMGKIDGGVRSPLHPKLITRGLGPADVVWILMLSVGGSMATRSVGKANMYIQVLEGGIGLHAATLVIFVTAVAVWRSRLSRDPSMEIKVLDHGVKLNVLCLYGVVGVMTMRSVGRLAEFLLGQNGFIAQNEWSFYVIDALQIAIALAMCLKFYGQDGRGSRRRSDMIELTDEGIDSEPHRESYRETNRETHHGRIEIG
ncbi:RTA1 like protein-domain-containing protein [Lophiotrema nucula]|uniref:RTA1 like protein-domain-containing protein n=1 Tax=Lophiotrema nucula TaxID=690887 RepID=A0A6A5YMC7_9PLEO|nr:RTA1 like protein-domain-containing protein [Lophiotrema nucula]